MSPTFDPSDQAVALDPYSTYATLREATPVFYSDATRLHFITRHADVFAAWRDRRLGSDFGERAGFDPAAQPWRDGSYPDFARFERWDLIAIEPPDHTRLRRLVLAAFTPRAVEAQRASIEARISAALESARERGRLDVVRDLAEPLSLGIICDLLGVWPGDQARVLELSHAVVSMYEPDPPSAQKALANDAAREFLAYAHDLIEERRRRPTSDLLTSLTEANVRGERLGDDQIASTAMVLLMAGHEASVNAAANGIAAFGRHPDEWRALRDGDVAVDRAVEEVLRWDPPLQYFHRWVLEDGFCVGGSDGPDGVSAGVAIPRGERVGLMIGSSNRDPRRFPDPDAFRIARGETAHLSFGGGIHFCVGAPLARMELALLLSALTQVLPAITLLEGAERRPGFQFRGYLRLPILPPS